MLENYQIKLRCLENIENNARFGHKKMQEIFENYATIQKKDFNIKFGKIIRLKTSKLSIKSESENVVAEKKIYLVKYEPTLKKNQQDYQQNLSFFYRDAFL